MNAEQVKKMFAAEDAARASEREREIQPGNGSDITERLRAYQCQNLSSCWFHHPDICDEAANEIDRLRAGQPKL